MQYIKLNLIIKNKIFMKNSLNNSIVKIINYRNKEYKKKKNKLKMQHLNQN